MKKFIIIVGSFLLCIVSLNVKAVTFTKPYAGVEILQTNIHYKRFYGDTIFGRTPLYFNFLGGINFHKYFGLEAGWGLQNRKTKTLRINRGESLGGATLGGIFDWQAHESSIKSNHTYFGIFGEGCIFGKSEATKIKGLIGVASTNVHAFNEPTNYGDPAGVFTHSQRQENRKSYKAHKIIPIVKASITHALTDHLRLGISASWRQLSRFKIISEQWYNENTIFTLKFKDAFSAGIRATYFLIK